MPAAQFEIADAQREPRFRFTGNVTTRERIIARCDQQATRFRNMIVDFKPAGDTRADRQCGTIGPHGAEHAIRGGVVAKFHRDFTKCGAIFRNIRLACHEIISHNACFCETVLREQHRDQRDGCAGVTIGAFCYRASRKRFGLEVVVPRSAFARTLQVQCGELAERECAGWIGIQCLMPDADLNITIATFRETWFVRSAGGRRVQRHQPTTGERQCGDSRDHRAQAEPAHHPWSNHRAASRYGNVVRYVRVLVLMLSDVRPVTTVAFGSSSLPKIAVRPASTTSSLRVRPP